MQVKIKKLHPDAVIPQYATDGAAGFDLVATETITIGPGQTKLVKTGLSVEVPRGFELQVRPRSGTSLKTTLRVSNSPGTVDSDYRGEVGVIMTNIASPCHDTFGNGCGCNNQGLQVHVNKGDRIAQGVITAVEHAEFVLVESLSDTARGAGGFGSTGTKA